MTNEGQAPFATGDCVSRSHLNDQEARSRRVISQSSAGPEHPGERTVLIVKAPNPAAPTLIVRQVVYVDTPPLPCKTEDGVETCNYALLVREVAMYPDFGNTTEDYADLVFDPAQDQLDTRAPFLKAHFEHRTWRLQKPSDGGQETALAVTWPQPPDPEQLENPEAKTLDVALIEILDGQMVEIITETITDEKGTETEEPIIRTVFVWPKLKREDYFEMMTANQVPVLRIEKHDGLWFARQLIPFVTTAPQRNRPAGGCIPR